MTTPTEQRARDRALRDNLRLWMSEDRERLLRSTLADYGAVAVSPDGLRCADLLARWLGGLHHFPGSYGAIAKTPWDRHFVRVALAGELSTTDANELTRLVFLSHDLCIRASLAPCNMQRVDLYLHPRVRSGDYMGRHPNIDEALAAHRKAAP